MDEELPRRGRLTMAKVFFLVMASIVLAGLVLPQISKIGEPANRMTSMNNLKQIGLACHEFADTHMSHFPTNSFLPTGEPQLSWRVYLLAYIEQDKLEALIQDDESWDGEKQQLLLTQRVRVYEAPYIVPPANTTHYRGFSHAGAMFEPRRETTLMREKRHPLGVAKEACIDGDGLANTIIAVEAREGIPWTQPMDLDAGPSQPLPPLGVVVRKHGGFNALFADGSVRWIKHTINEEHFRSLLTYAGNEALHELD